MEKIFRDDREYWIGCHKKIGVVIFDPLSQLDVDDLKVRLFKVKEKRMGTFIKDMVKEQLVSCDTYFSENNLTPRAGQDLINSAINFYHELRLRTRITHCYDCKRPLDAIDFSVCKKCGWIKCKCRACGCGFLNIPTAKEEKNLTKHKALA